MVEPYQPDLYKSMPRIRFAVPSVCRAGLPASRALVQGPPAGSWSLSAVEEAARQIRL